MYPLVRELAVDGIPVTVTFRVLKFTRAPYYTSRPGCVTTHCHLSVQQSPSTVP